MFDKDWEELREEVLKYNKEKQETLLKNWLNKIGFTEPIGYYFNYSERELELYTIRPGILIGKRGVNVLELKDMMSKEFVGEWKVKFIEIRGGFITV